MTTGTIRQQLVVLLEAGAWDVRGLSQALGIAEREVIAHLPHVKRSLEGSGAQLVIQPAVCRSCGFTFKGRGRFTRPGRCPRCRRTHIAPPAFHVA
ncbi:MAG: transcriptional regulator [Desulfobacterales bacterium]|nr:transcriptional regulator [Desulfobacterales bacterium]